MVSRGGESNNISTFIQHSLLQKISDKLFILIQYKVFSIHVIPTTKRLRQHNHCCLLVLLLLMHIRPSIFLLILFVLFLFLNEVTMTTSTSSKDSSITSLPPMKNDFHHNTTSSLMKENNKNNIKCAYQTDGCCSMRSQLESMSMKQKDILSMSNNDNIPTTTIKQLPPSSLLLTSFRSNDLPKKSDNDIQRTQNTEELNSIVPMTSQNCLTNSNNNNNNIYSQKPMTDPNDIRQLLMTEAQYDDSDVNNNITQTTKRNDYLSWDDYFMATAILSSYRSKDPIRPTGACIVDQSNRIIGTGYNGFPIGCSDDILPWNSYYNNDSNSNNDVMPGSTSNDDIKLFNWLHTSNPYVVSAVVNAILNKCSSDCMNAKLYTMYYPTHDCAKIIIQSGIKEVIYMVNNNDSEKINDNDNVVTNNNDTDSSSIKNNDPYSIRASRILFKLAGVQTRPYQPLNKSIVLNFTNTAAVTHNANEKASFDEMKEVLDGSTNDDTLSLIDPIIPNNAADLSFLYRNILMKEANYDPINPPIGSITKRHDTLSWDDYFMSMAFLSAKRSKDPNTQVGACIVDPNTHKILGLGYNGFPIGCSDDYLPWSRTSGTNNNNPLHTKYMYVVHAEQNAILNKGSSNVYGSTIYIALFPCNECAKVIIQAGIREIVYMNDTYHNTESCIASRILFQLSGVKIRHHIPKKSYITLSLF